MDGRGLLAFDWITIPAAGGEPELTISKDSPTNSAVLDALFWQYADGDTGLLLENGVLRGTAASGVFADIDLVSGVTTQAYATPFVLKQMDLDLALSSEVAYAAEASRAGLLNTAGWHVASRPCDSISILFVSLSGNYYGLNTIPAGLSGVTAIAAGYDHILALQRDGTVVGWGYNYYGQATPPAGLSGITAIAAGQYHSLALKDDGTVVGWGDNYDGQTSIPAGLSGVTAIAAGSVNSLALKDDGTVVGWGYNWNGETSIPAGLSGVTAIAAGKNHCLALKDDGTVVAWGNNAKGETSIPAGLSGFTAIAVGSGGYSLALKAVTP